MWSCWWGILGRSETTRMGQRFFVMKFFYRFLIFTFGSPAIIVTIFCFAIGTSPVDLELGVLNYEIDTNCTNYIGMTTCEPNQLSCAFIKSLESDRKFKLVKPGDFSMSTPNFFLKFHKFSGDYWQCRVCSKKSESKETLGIRRISSEFLSTHFWPNPR